MLCLIIKLVITVTRASMMCMDLSAVREYFTTVLVYHVTDCVVNNVTLCLLVSSDSQDVREIALSLC